MKNTEQDQHIGYPVPIVVVRRSIRLQHTMGKDYRASKETIDLTSGEDEDVLDKHAGTHPGKSNTMKRKISEREGSRCDAVVRKVKAKGVSKVQKAANAGVVGKVKRKGERYYIVAEKQGGDDGIIKKGSGKRRLVLSKDKGTGKLLGDRKLNNNNVPDAGEVKKARGKEKLVGHNKKGEKLDDGKDKGTKRNIGRDDGALKKGNHMPNNGKADVAAGTKQSVDRIHLRVSMWSLHRLIHNLSPKQREDVTDMGFGPVLGFKIKDVPTRLSYWLLDNFDEDARVLNVCGKSISVTRETVNDVLGLPMGDVTVEARDEADFRHPLVVEWKSQFGRKERYLHVPVENLMYTQLEGGWMFMLNFLVLYFTSIGESNKNATVNLRFLQCINDAHDIPSFDWCSYVLECLIKTKKNWVRTSHYTGPVIVLLILYAHSIKPRVEDDKVELPLINNWTVDLLNQLEEDMIQVEEVKKTVAAKYKMAGDLLEEAGELLDEAIAKRPQDAELIELKDLRDVLFGERKCSQPPKDSPKPQDSAKPTDSHKSKDCPNMEEPIDAGCRTPERDANPYSVLNDLPYPYTQEYGSPSPFIAYAEEVELQRSKEMETIRKSIRKSISVPPVAFDDAPSFDLNLTQGTQTQRKDDDSIEETQKLLEYLSTYDSQQEPNLDVYQTPEHKKGVPAGSRVSGNGSGKMVSSAVTTYNICDATPLQRIPPKVVNVRMRCDTKPGGFMCSPYMKRAVCLRSITTSHEQRAADCLFSGRFAETDILFKTDHVNGPRGVLESLFPGIRIASGAVDIFTKILNYSEKFRDPLKSMQKVFCETTLVNEWDVDGCKEKERDVKEASDRFIRNMESILTTTVYKSLVFFPIIHGTHFYVICMHMKNMEVHILDNMSSFSTDVTERYGDVVEYLVARFEEFLAHTNHPLQGRLRNAEQKVLRLGCMTTQNFIDCGVFTMRHMETYLGGGEYDDLCGLRREGKEQQGLLNDLRIRYAAKILLSDINQAKSAFEKEADDYKRLSLKEKQRFAADAFERIKARVTHML